MLRNVRQLKTWLIIRIFVSLLTGVRVAGGRAARSRAAGPTRAGKSVFQSNTFEFIHGSKFLVVVVVRFVRTLERGPSGALPFWNSAPPFWNDLSIVVSLGIGLSSAVSSQIQRIRHKKEKKTVTQLKCVVAFKKKKTNKTMVNEFSSVRVELWILIN